MKNAHLISGKVAQQRIADTVGVSFFTAYCALRIWASPVIARKNLTLYAPSAVEQVINKFTSGNWPERKSLFKSGFHKSSEN
jgi:hypothetical protein